MRRTIPKTHAGRLFAEILEKRTSFRKKPDSNDNDLFDAALCSIAELQRTMNLSDSHPLLCDLKAIVKKHRADQIEEDRRESRKLRHDLVKPHMRFTGVTKVSLAIKEQLLDLFALHHSGREIGLPAFVAAAIDFTPKVLQEIKDDYSSVEPTKIRIVVNHFLHDLDKEGVKALLRSIMGGFVGNLALDAPFWTENFDLEKIHRKALWESMSKIIFPGR